MGQRNDNRYVYVYAHWVGIKEPVFMGDLKAEFVRGKEIFSFSYAEDWLKSRFHKYLIRNYYSIQDHNMQVMRNQILESFLILSLIAGEGS